MIKNYIIFFIFLYVSWVKDNLVKGVTHSLKISLKPAQTNINIRRCLTVNKLSNENDTQITN